MQHAEAWSAWVCTAEPLEGPQCSSAVAQMHAREWIKLHKAAVPKHSMASLQVAHKHQPEGALTASSSFWVSSSILLMSSIVRSIHLSIQQNSWRWKLVNILFSCFKKIRKHYRRGLHPATRQHSDCSSSLSTRSTYLLYKVFHFVLQSPPFKFNRHQLVSTHFRALFISC